MNKSLLLKVVMISVSSIIAVEILRLFYPNIMTTQIVGPLIVSISTIVATLLVGGMSKR